MTQVNLSDIIMIQKGKKPNEIKPECFDGFFPYVDIKAFETGKIDKFTNGENCVKCEDGDLLIVCDGSRSGLIGKAVKGFVGSTLARIDCDLSVDKDYLYYFIQSKYKLLNSNVKGTGTPHLKQELLKSFRLYLPSIEQQKQIVKRIEESLSQLNSAVATLKKTKQQLEIYRQAVLKEAFSNNTTWAKHTLKDLALDFRNGYSKKPDDKGQYKILRISAVRAMSINLNDYRLNITPFNEPDTIKPYDLLFTRYNGSAEYVGVCSCVPDIKDCFAYPDKIIRCRLKEPDIYLAKFLEYYLNHGEARQYIRKHIKTTSGQNGIASSDIQKITVYIPEKVTQKAIVKEIEERLSNCEMIEQIVNKSLQQAEALRQSILKQAFEGNIL